MPTSIITTDDLREFKMELLEDIKDLLTKQTSGKIKKYLKSSEVMDLLQVSPGTLQNLRINGTLPYSKVGGIIYYDVVEIQNVMDSNRVQREINYKR
ncbi:helix-turn-helix domain-containing protein [Gillisia sp. Hel_I_29]|uniref:helix-turn-helix domain-containing protein n=1 Tax=Gillisia sp. Hel_I_29 TaxID=1249975 RepID=UPI0005507ABD|nr:helix-turn-helix domain-containing protein [Gillisia sp. Hel_I_29]